MANTLQSKNRTAVKLPNHWPLQNAKAQFSELIRRAKNDGPQHVTVHGREEVVVITTEQFNRLQGVKTGMAIVEAMQACPDKDFNFGRQGDAMPISSPVSL